MKNNNRLIIMLLWVVALFAVYILNLFGFLTSVQTGGYYYYLVLFVLLLVLYSHYYYVFQKDAILKVRSLLKPLILSTVLLIVLLLILSVLLPGIFKRGELDGYRRRFESNGYSPEEIHASLRSLSGMYTLFLSITCFATHFLIGLVALVFFKVGTLIKKKKGQPESEAVIVAG